MAECWVGLLFSSPVPGMETMRETWMKHDVVASPLGGYLADGLQEGLGLDIAHGAADLHDGHVSVRGVQRVNVPLDLIGDVGDDLDRGSQIVARSAPG